MNPKQPIHLWKSLLLLSTVFLFVGSIVCMNDILLPSLKNSLHLSYYAASFVQQSFFLVYLIFPIPVAYYISKRGYKTALITALAICSLGCSLFIPAYLKSSFALALAALFVLSIGVTVINVAGNPMAALLGKPEGSHVRVNFVQVLSRVGYSLTPLLATRLIYGDGQQIYFHHPYMAIGTGTLILAFFIFLSRLPPMKPDATENFSLFSIIREARQYPQLWRGAIAMFFYMGAEASTAGFFISYLQDNSQAGLGPDQAAVFLTFYYITATIMGFLSISLFRFFSAGRMVVIYGSGMAILLLILALTRNPWNPYLMSGLGIFISILFPTVFSLGIEGIGPFTEKGSALMNIAIVGGACFPPIQGMIADAKGVQISYMVPCFCIVIIVLYGVYCDRRSLLSRKAAKARPVT
ncbi:MAG: MFS transporter [Chitinophagales bacterium]